MTSLLDRCSRDPQLICFLQEVLKQHTTTMTRLEQAGRTATKHTIMTTTDLQLDVYRAIHIDPYHAIVPPSTNLRIYWTKLIFRQLGKRGCDGLNIIDVLQDLFSISLSARKQGVRTV